METMQLTFTFKEGTKPAEIATKLRWHAGLLEGLSPKEAASVKNTAAVPTVEEVDDVEADDDEDFAPKKKTAKQRIAAAFDAEDEEDEIAEEDDEDVAPKKKAAPVAKAKKITLDDVNDACKARAAATGGKEGRAEVLTILKKKFKTTSVSELDPDQYADVMKAMKV